MLSFLAGIVLGSLLAAGAGFASILIRLRMLGLIRGAGAFGGWGGGMTMMTGFGF